MQRGTTATLHFSNWSVGNCHGHLSLAIMCDPLSNRPLRLWQGAGSSLHSDVLHCKTLTALIQCYRVTNQTKYGFMFKYLCYLHAVLLSSSSLQCKMTELLILKEPNLQLFGVNTETTRLSKCKFFYQRLSFTE